MGESSVGAMCAIWFRRGQYSVCEYSGAAAATMQFGGTGIQRAGMASEFIRWVTKAGGPALRGLQMLWPVTATRPGNLKGLPGI